MKLIDNAGQATRLWSVRLAAVAAGLAAAEASLPLWADVIPAGVFAALSSAVAVAAAVARIIKQDLSRG